MWNYLDFNYTKYGFTLVLGFVVLRLAGHDNFNSILGVVEFGFLLGQIITNSK